MEPLDDWPPRKTNSKEKTNEKKLTRDARATADGVLDPRTCIILLKMLNSNLLTEINGCVSTGKEANVYHAIAAQQDQEGSQDVAVKVYKTSVLTFKDRDRYVTGEFRWRHGYCRSNPRKMVRMWAEKEMRNYRRLHQAGLPCPTPIVLRDHVLVMSFVGYDGHAAPRLKDATLSRTDAASAAPQTFQLLRALFFECHLVHADFSEYNLLWFNGKVYVIDVSQSVEHDHPNALDFLRKDCENAISFFRRLGVPGIPTLEQLFHYVTDAALPNGAYGSQEALDAYASLVASVSMTGSCAASAAEAEIRERVFAQIHIPRTLSELPARQIESDLQKVRDGDVEQLSYARLNGLDIADKEEHGSSSTVSGNHSDNINLSQCAKSNSEDEYVSLSDGQGSSDEEDVDDVNEDARQGLSQRAARLHRFEDPEEKRARKAKVKADRAEARKRKTPKHVKKAKSKSGNKK